MVFSQHFLVPATVTEVSPGLSNEAYEPFFFFPAVGFIYLFIVTFMSTVQGSCWFQQHRPQPEGWQGNSNPSLSPNGLVTLAKSLNLDTLGLSFITKQGSE